MPQHKMTDRFEQEVEKMMARLAEEEASAKWKEESELHRKKIEEEAKYRLALSKVPSETVDSWNRLLENKDEAYQILMSLPVPTRCDCCGSGFPNIKPNCRYRIERLKFVFLHRELAEYIKERRIRKLEEAERALAEKKAAKEEAARREAAEKAEEERRRIEQYNANKETEFHKWINNGAYHSSGSYDSLGRFGVASWSDSELSIRFWKYMSELGFSTCPTCGLMPRINRLASWYYAGNKVEVMKEGLFPQLPSGDYYSCGSSKIKTISCCEHLYDFEQKYRYIKVSALKHNESPTVKYQVCFMSVDSYGKKTWGYTTNIHEYPDCMPEYVPFNPEDADGSLALAAHQERMRLSRIKALRSTIARMQRELASLTGNAESPDSTLKYDY